jgi:hypothetical protein
MTAHVCPDTAYPAAAMPDECTCGGPMTDPTCAERIHDHMAGRSATILHLQAIASGPAMWGLDEDGERIEQDDATDRLYEMPLSVEVIRHIKILLGTGGPADWLDAELDAEGEIRTLEYHFADWYDHAQTYVERDSPLWQFAETFTEYASITEDTYR